MKVTHLKIVNIGIVESEDIQINKPLVLFYGSIRAGKTTILNCVRWVCGGEFPSDILRHGAKEGLIELHFDNAMISRSFYLSKTGKEVKSRPIEFIRDGRPVAKPVDEIKKLLNPFTLDQDYLIRMSEVERNRYFVGLFGVDTADIDNLLTSLESDATKLRSVLGAYGDIDLTEHKPADATKLKADRQAIVDDATFKRRALEASLESINNAHGVEVNKWRLACMANDKHNLHWDSVKQQIDRDQQEIKDLQVRIGKLQEAVDANAQKLTDNPKKENVPEPTATDTTEIKQQILALHSPDTAAIDAQLSDAAAANVKAEQYQRNLARENERLAKAKELEAKTTAIKTKREERLARLQSINENCKIPGLSFTDDGEFVYEGTKSSMLSTSQLMTLSKKLSDLYPDGLSIQLLDRGESLGKSIFDLIDRSKAESKTILATVVGERPAVVPEQVGVYVVEQGKVLQ